MAIRISRLKELYRVSSAAIFCDSLCDIVVVILTNALVTVATVDDPARETDSSVLVLTEPENKEYNKNHKFVLHPRSLTISVTTDASRYTR